MSCSSCCFARFYQYLIYFGGLLKSPLLLLLRIYAGYVFASAGLSKFHDIGPLQVVLEQNHFIFPKFFAYATALTELVGGVCLFLGFASRLVAIPLIIVMLSAYGIAHSDAWMNFFINPHAFIQANPFYPLLASLLVFAFGPGRFSLDYMCEKCLFNKADEIPKHVHK